MKLNGIISNGRRWAAGEIGETEVALIVFLTFKGGKIVFTRGKIREES